MVLPGARTRRDCIRYALHEGGVIVFRHLHQIGNGCRADVVNVRSAHARIGEIEMHGSFRHGSNAAFQSFARALHDKLSLLASLVSRRCDCVAAMFRNIVQDRSFGTASLDEGGLDMAGAPTAVPAAVDFGCHVVRNQ
ncbi:MAG TPA: hypothetical protein VMU81_10630 [Acetobacteraceae bacterium]|nr:hypothetical protein [Acetobacteraceae bacterium]